MSNPYPNDLTPLNMARRSRNICRTALEQHRGQLRRQGGDWDGDIENILVENAALVRDQGQAVWDTIWTPDRADDLTPGDAVRAWRQALIAWAQTNLTS